jgi:hypothetical protein
MVVVSLLMVPLVGALGCGTCEVCGAYFSKRAGGEDYLKINGDGTFEGAQFAGTWELQDEGVGYGTGEFANLVLTSPAFGVKVYLVLHNESLVATDGSGNVYRRAP